MGPSFNPYAPPQSPSAAGGVPGPIRGAGGTITFSRETWLPDVCVKCATRDPAVLQRRTKQYIFIPWYGRLFGLLGHFLTRKMARVALPVCRVCDARYRTGVVVMWCALGAAAWFLGILAVGGALDVDALVALATIGFVISVIALPLLFFTVAFRRMMPLAQKIDDAEVTLTRVHPDAALAMIAISMSATSYRAQAAAWPRA